jgi:diguanylate cyclase (GGDEF)-like protein
MIDNHSKDNVILTFAEKYNREIEYLSFHDDLTGLSNRRRFENRLKSEWKRSVREHGTLALILVDVDYFKQYNDTYGHLAGDECLRRIAKTLQACCKRPADLSARYGGEEFIILLPDTNVEGATIIAETIREKVEDLNIRHETSAAHTIVTVSVGVAVIKPSRLHSQNELIARAGEALYFAKQHGRNLVSLIPDSLLQGTSQLS